MKILFLDFDGVITTYKSKWTIDLEKLNLIDMIVQKTGAQIVVTSSWKHGCSNATEFKSTICSKRCVKALEDRTPLEVFLDQIYDITDSRGSLRGEEIKRWLDTHEVESYVILDDDSDMLKEQLFNFVQTDTYYGLSEREAEFCIMILNKCKIPNPIRINLELTTMWRNNCLGQEKNDIKELLEEYYNTFK